MTLVKAIVAAACLVAASGKLCAQTRIDLRTQASSVVDFGTATFTRPIRTGTVLPALCDTGELFFKSDAPAGANVYACVSRNVWAAPAAPVTGALLPNPAGHAGKSLWTDGVNAAWKNVTTGASGALELTQTGSEVSLDIVPAVVPQKSAANFFSGLNTFGLGIQLMPQSAPASPENGRIWYDSALQKFRCRQNGVTFDCISAATTRTIAAGSGISVADGDGVNGDPTISVTADLVNLTVPQTASTALMGPVAGGPGAPAFRALTETDLPSSLARKPAANIFTSLNSFGAGIQLLPQGTPALPDNGQIWYDANVHKFRCHQNDVTSDCIGGGSTRIITAGSGIDVANGDGVNGDPTISVASDLLNLTAPQIAATALMGPVAGGPGAPAFRALTETDLPGAVALKTAANTFTAVNTFDAGIQLSPQAPPANPENGHIWYDSAVGRLRAMENGQTVDVRGGEGLGDPGQNGLIVRTAPNTTTVATPGVDYLPPTTGTAIQKSDGAGGLSAATAGVDFAAPEHLHVYPIYGTGNTAVSAGSTQFVNLVGGAIVTNTSIKRTIMTHGPGILTNFWIVTGNNAGPGTMTCSVQKFVSGSWTDTGLSVSVSTNAIGNVGQSTGSATYSAGDQFIVACTNTASSSSTIGAWSMQDIH
jgi:hypothetical protein